jgi:hypothetical protein
MPFLAISAARFAWDKEEHRYRLLRVKLTQLLFDPFSTLLSRRDCLLFLNIIDKSRILSILTTKTLFVITAIPQKSTPKYFCNHKSYLFRKGFVPCFQSLNLAFFRFFWHDNLREALLKSHKLASDRSLFVWIRAICINLSTMDLYQ